MTIKQIEKKIEEKNCWLIERENGTYDIQSMRTGNYLFSNETLQGIEECLDYILMRLDEMN